MDNKKIGLFIANMRKEKKLTQKNLASKLYVSDKAVSKWERGICMPDISLMEKLAEILEVGVSDILKGEKLEDITKQNTDEIVKKSIPFFQKKYFKKKFIRIVIGLCLFLSLGYLFLLILGEFNNGELRWSIWGNELSIDLPTITKIKAKKDTGKFLKAISNYDLETISQLIKENESRLYDDLTDWITYEEYLESLQYIKESGIVLEKYKYNYCFNYYISSLKYSCGYELIYNYNNEKYKLTLELVYNSGAVMVGENLRYDHYEYGKLDNEYKSFYQIENKELVNNIVKIFSKF